MPTREDRLELEIQKLKEETAALKKENNYARQVLNGLDKTLVAFDTNGLIIRIDGDYSILNKFSEKFSVGNKITVAFAQHQNELNKIDELISGGKPESIVYIDNSYFQLVYRRISIDALVFEYIIAIRSLSHKEFDKLALQQSQDKYKFMIHNSIDALSLFENGKLAYVSPAIESIYGYSPNELYEMANPFSLIYEPDRNNVFTVIENDTLNKRLKSKIKYRVVRKDGTLTWVEDNIYKSFDEFGNLLFTVVNTRNIDIQIASEKNLITIQEKMTSILENAMIGIAITDKEGYYEFTNKTYENIFGYGREELLGKPFTTIAPNPKMISVWQARNFEFFRRGFEIDNEWKAKDKVGNELYILSSAIKIVDVDGQEKKVSFVTDISERKGNEKKLVELNNELAEFKFAIDSASIVSISDLKGSILSVNSKFLEVSGYDSDEIIGQKFSFINSNYHSKSYFLDMWTKLIKGQLWTGEFRNRAKNGKIFWLESTIIPLKNTLGNVKGYLSLSQDISARKIAQEKLRIAELTYRTLVNNLPETLFTVNADLRLEYVNSNFAKFLQKDENELINSHIKELPLNETRINNLAENIAMSFKNNKSNDFYVKDVIEDKVKHLLVRTVPLSIEKDIVDSVMVIGTDVTELKAAIESKDSFMTILAHDMRSPFSGFLGLLDLLENDFEEIEIDQTKKIINSLNKSAKRMYELLDNLLEWSRAQLGKMEPEIVDLDISVIVDNTIKLFEENITKKSLVMESKLPKFLYCQVDSNMLRTICRNMISNSIKFTPNGGMITISHSSENEFVKLSFTDTGVGMSESDINKLIYEDTIFTTPGTSKEQGTGLGVKLVKELAKLNGGTMEIFSEKGLGTSFVFSFRKSNL